MSQHWDAAANKSCNRHGQQVHGMWGLWFRGRPGWQSRTVGEQVWLVPLRVFLLSKDVAKESPSGR